MPEKDNCDEESVLPNALGRAYEDFDEDVALMDFGSRGPVGPWQAAKAAAVGYDSSGGLAGVLGVPQRYLVVGAGFAATFSMYMDRTGFALAYTMIAKELDLDEATKGFVLSAFYYGYAAAQIPGGMLAARFGGQKTLTVSFCGWGTLTLLLPVVSNSVFLVSAMRMLIGAIQGVIIPSIHTVLAEWVPLHEKSRALSVATSGMYLGSTAAIAFLPGLLAIFGPQIVMEGIALLALAWLLLWLGLGTIPTEKERISHAQGSVSSGVSVVSLSEMLRSPAVWAIIINSFTFHYSLYMIMNWMPTYFEHVVQVQLNSLGNVKMVPYLLMFMCSNLGGALGDALIKRGGLVGRTRKLINTAGFTAAAGAQFCMAHANGVAAGIGVIALTLAALGFARGGFSINHMDIAPGRAGVLIGIINCAGTVAGIAGVSITGLLLESSGGASSVEGWLRATVLASLLCVAGAMFFAIHAKGVVIFA